MTEYEDEERWYPQFQCLPRRAPLGVANQPFSRPEQLVATDRLTQVRLLSADVRLAIDGRPAYDAPRRHRDFCPVWPR